MFEVLDCSRNDFICSCNKNTDLAGDGKLIEFKNAASGEAHSTLSDDGAIVKLNLAAPAKDEGVVTLTVTGKKANSGCGAWAFSKDGKNWFKDPTNPHRQHSHPGTPHVGGYGSMVSWEQQYATEWSGLNIQHKFPEGAQYFVWATGCAGQVFKFELGFDEP